MVGELMFFRLGVESLRRLVRCAKMNRLFVRFAHDESFNRISCDLTI